MWRSKSGSSDRMESVIEDIKKNREKATEVIDAAEERRSQWLGSVHLEAKARIRGNAEENQKSLAELAERLRSENEEKKREVIENTTKKIKALQENGRKHLDEIADLLYKTVISVADE